MIPDRSPSNRNPPRPEREAVTSGARQVPPSPTRRDRTDKRDIVTPETVDAMGIMAKYWEPGRVKTRLGASVGMGLAAELHRIFVLHLCEVLAGVDAAKQVVVAPDEKRADVAATLPSSWSVVGQGSGELGRRMARWFQTRLGTDSDEGVSPESVARPRAVLIGGDCLTVVPTVIAEAFEKLAIHDVVIGPSADGGYYLIGIAGHWNPARAALFENVPWGTERVAETTRRRVESAKLSAAELALKEDIDTIDEFSRLRESLASRRATRREPDRRERPDQRERPDRRERPDQRERPDPFERLRRSIDAALARGSSEADAASPDGCDSERSR